MRVALGLADEAGCGHYRGIYPGNAANLAGAEVFRLAHMPVRHDPQLRVTGLYADLGCEVVVLQRPLSRVIAESVPFIQAQGVAVVVDVDDDFSAVHPDHYGYPKYQPETSPEKNRRHLARACAQADLVTVTTPALARVYGEHGRVAVLPNYVPAAYLQLAPVVPRDGLTVGWPGWVPTHPTDLQETRGGVAMAVRETPGARFRNIGDGWKVAEYLGFNEGEIDVTGPVELSLYPEAIAALDVGIVPLAEGKFNDGKSALKGLELAAVGVPFVASPTIEYRRMAATGIGVTAASRSRSWKAQVKRLLGDEGRQLAQEARSVIAREHTVETNAWRWLEAWETASLNAQLRIRRNGSRT